MDEAKFEKVKGAEPTGKKKKARVQFNRRTEKDRCRKEFRGGRKIWTHRKESIERRTSFSADFSKKRDLQR